MKNRSAQSVGLTRKFDSVTYKLYQEFRDELGLIGSKNKREAIGKRDYLKKHGFLVRIVKTATHRYLVYYRK